MSSRGAGRRRREMALSLFKAFNDFLFRVILLSLARVRNGRFRMRPLIVATRSAGRTASRVKRRKTTGTNFGSGRNVFVITNLRVDGNLVRLNTRIFPDRATMKDRGFGCVPIVFGTLTSNRDGSKSLTLSRLTTLFGGVGNYVMN